MGGEKAWKANLDASIEEAPQPVAHDARIGSQQDADKCAAEDSIALWNSLLKGRSSSLLTVSDQRNRRSCQKAYGQQAGAGTHIKVDVIHEPEGCSPKQPVPKVCDQQAEAVPVVACKQREAVLC